ncbi:hypothetical protein L211DRAFT_374993 [Terfezia boudieri ATCC MYA-4762]|uniref:Uncharacterized protein n=1 Tax=Terfezia boudieri ATCC MYA-4762 TaxID=1051890 RepID=A0A3N4M351_9PEZI|nr:hypothetical protein L211DRAFT_374993 [Terfezia boudieri ATCC MYA-4762]
MLFSHSATQLHLILQFLPLVSNPSLSPHLTPNHSFNPLLSIFHKSNTLFYLLLNLISRSFPSPDLLQKAPTPFGPDITPAFINTA